MQNKITIDHLLCKGCGLCTLVCPKKIVSLDKNVINNKGYNPAVITEMEQCIACAMCAIMCPDSAIKVEKGA